jgi:uncharacterized protein YxjI
VYENEGGNPILSIHRGVQLFTAKVRVTLRGRDIGYFQSKAFSLGGTFRIFDANNQEVGLVKGDWKGWNFQMLTATNEQLGTVTKKWAGLGKELFTSADTYAISLSDAAATRTDVAPLLLAAGLAVDVVFKEKK